MDSEEYFSVEQAAEHAKKWCASRPAWMRLCDMSQIDSDQFYVQWHELSKRDQEGWGSKYAYDEFSIKRQKVEMGFMSGKGEFYSDICAVPRFHNLMQMIRVGAKLKRATTGNATADDGKDK